MKHWFFVLAALTLSACSAAIIPAGASGGQPQPVKADLPNLGAAPEFTNDVWLNTDKPLRLKDLRGKVVLIDMWTFG